VAWPLGQKVSPHIQRVTTACRHYLEPACLFDCPTNALRNGSDHGRRAARRVRDRGTGR